MEGERKRQKAKETEEWKDRGMESLLERTGCNP